MSDAMPNVFVELPAQELVDFIKQETDYKDDDYVTASIIAARYDDPNVPHEIYTLLKGYGGSRHGASTGMD